jgi:hypothetical protein
MQGQYCKCKNIYTVRKCNKKRCNAAYYWKQGIGRTVAVNNGDDDTGAATP